MKAASQSKKVIGFGSPDSDLSADVQRAIVKEALASIGPGSKVLAIVPDKTRDDATDLLVPAAAEFLATRNVERFDALIAQGTHGPMTAAEKGKKLGLGDGTTIPGLGEVFDHKWADENELVELGVLSATRVSELTGGLFSEAIPVRINRLLTPGVYDHILIFGGSVPHEVAGFAGGAKYFFPGVSGRELTNATHWLGALAGIENIIGRIETPTRNLIEAAAEFVEGNVICFTSVVTREPDDRLRTRALFAGDARQSLREAAAVSSAVHIKYTGRRYGRVVAILDEHYDELWVGGKASYKLGGIIEDGGELIIYAPRLRCLSTTHGEMIERYGYAPIEQVTSMVADSPELRDNLCVAAHLAHVSYAGRKDASGNVVPKYKITLASMIDEQTCRKVNLGYLDPNEFRVENYQNDADTLIVDRAGRDLYLVEPK